MNTEWIRPDGTVDEGAFRLALARAGDEAEACSRERAARHAAFHGRTAVNQIRVEGRSGYRSRSVCGDCYYGKEWDRR